MGIAIMILVHTKEHQVQRLINHLSKDFDVYVHIDKRSKMKIIGMSNVAVYAKYKVYWGSANQIRATLFLLQKAFEKGYDRYILISGQDMPIKSNEEIKEFFRNNKAEYMAIDKIPREDGWPNMGNLTAYHLNNKYYKIEDRIKYDILFRFQRKVFHIINKIKTRKLDYDFYGGSNWTNYTHNCVLKIFEYLRKDKKFIKRFWWTNCADEIFFQTIVYQLNGIEIVKDSLRYVDWESGPERPRILRGGGVIMIN